MSKKRLIVRIKTISRPVSDRNSNELLAIGFANDAEAYIGAAQQLEDFRSFGELSRKVGDGGNRKGGISWGCLTPPLLHRRSDMPCSMITSPS
jgi:hypothetical protein